MHEVVSALTASGAGTAAIVIDACRSRVSRDTTNFYKQTLELSRREGVVVFCGCSPGEVCQELLKELGHGVFTYSFIKAITDDSATVPVDIDRQVTQYVTDLCRTHKLEKQVPYTSVVPLHKAMLDLFTGTLKASTVRPRKCVLILGPSNSGKTTLGEAIASECGLLHVEMSSFGWRRFRERDAHFRGSLQDYLEQVCWRDHRGDILARDLLSSDKGVDQLVVCGARRVEEVEMLRQQNWDVPTIFLWASSNLRYDRYLDEGEAGWELDYERFIRKDMREYAWGLAKTALMPQVETLVNEGTWDELLAKVVTPDFKRWIES